MPFCFLKLEFKWGTSNEVIKCSNKVGFFSHVEATFNIFEKCDSRQVQKAKMYLQISLVVCNYKHRFLKVIFHRYGSVKLQAPKSFTGSSNCSCQQLLAVQGGTAVLYLDLSHHRDIASIRYLQEVLSWREIWHQALCRFMSCLLCSLTQPLASSMI